MKNNCILLVCLLCTSLNPMRRKTEEEPLLNNYIKDVMAEGIILNNNPKPSLNKLLIVYGKLAGFLDCELLDEGDTIQAKKIYQELYDLKIELEFEQDFKKSKVVSFLDKVKRKKFATL